MITEAATTLLAGHRKDWVRYLTLHDCTVEQSALQMQEASVLHHRLVHRYNDPVIPCRLAMAIIADALAANSRSIWMREDVPSKHLRNDSGQTSCSVVFLAEPADVDPPRVPLRPNKRDSPLSSRLDIHDQRQLIAHTLPVVAVQGDPDVLCNRDQVNDRVCRSANRSIDCNGVLECFLRHDVRRLDVLANEVNDAEPGLLT